MADSTRSVTIIARQMRHAQQTLGSDWLLGAWKPSFAG
jgi:hypothetical protein